MQLLSRRAGCGSRPDQVSREGSGPMAASQPHPPPTFSVFLPFFLSYTFFFYTTPLKSPGPGRTHPMVLVCYLRERQSPNAHRGGGAVPVGTPGHLCPEDQARGNTQTGTQKSREGKLHGGRPKQQRCRTLG